jgi:hypothetical protein
VAAREDTVAKRVYFYRNNTEYLAYDFSLNTNDTISLNDNGCILTVRIMNTDSIILDNGEKRKRLFLDIGSEWIEGIGSTFGLNYPIFFWCAYDVSSLLSCFEENDTLKYTSPFLSQCFNYTVGIDHIKNNPLIVSPNPFSDFTILKSKIDFLGTDKIMLLGIDGRLIKTFDNQFGNEFKLSREGIENGIYILRIMRNDLCIASIRVLID